MADFPELFVLRHGQTEWNVVGRHQGRLDSPLTETGRGQAVEQGQILTGLLADRADIIAQCSPQGRALKTAQIALPPRMQKPKIDDRLCEIHFGDWQGLTIAEIAQRWPERCGTLDQDPFAWHFNAPNGESFDQIHSRTLAFLKALSGPAVVITHGITSRVLRGIWLGLEMDEMGALVGGQGCVYHLSHGTMRRYPEI